MPRAARIRLIRNGRSRLLPWTVDIPASLSSTGDRQRTGYGSRAEAERAASAESRRLTSYSEKSFGLTDAQKVEAAECFALLVPFPARTLRDAAHLAVRTWQAESASVSLPEMAEAFFRDRGADGRDATYRSKVRGLVLRLAKELPAGTRVNAVTSSMVDGWLRSLPGVGPVARNNYRRHLSAGFGLALEQGWCATNPCGKVPTARVPDAPVVIFTPDEADRLLRAAHPKVVAWLALGLFAGLRPSEAQRLAWSDIGTEHIRIHAHIAKTRRSRLVPVLDPLAAWLARADRKARTGQVSCSRWWLDRARAAAGVSWHQDVLRHSFGTYRGLLLTNEGQLAAEMGNSPDVISKHYRHGHATPEAAREFFNIHP